MRVVGRHHVNAYFAVGANPQQTFEVQTWVAIAGGAFWYTAVDITTAYPAAHPAAYSTGSLDWTFPMPSGVTIEALIDFATQTVLIQSVT